MGELKFNIKKTLKLTNVLMYKFLLDESNSDIEATIKKIQSYIKVKGAEQVGPLGQRTCTFVAEDGKIDVEMVLMLQCDVFIHNVEQPYIMQSIVRVPDALYCRYVGPENKISFAYSKIKIEAFEKNIELEDYNYTIYLQCDGENEVTVADVFVPRK